MTKTGTFHPIIMALHLAMLLFGISAGAAQIEVVGKHIRPNNSVYSFKVFDGDALSPGDRFQIIINADSTTHYAILYLSRDNTLTQIFPSSGQTGKIRAGARRLVPAGENYFTLDTNGGRELIFIVTSPDAITNLRPILRNTDTNTSSAEIHAYLKKELPQVMKLEITNTGKPVALPRNQISNNLVQDIEKVYAKNPWLATSTQEQYSRNRTRQGDDNSIPDIVRRRAKEIRSSMKKPPNTDNFSSLIMVQETKHAEGGRQYQQKIKMTEFIQRQAEQKITDRLTPSEKPPAAKEETSKSQTEAQHQAKEKPKHGESQQLAVEQAATQATTEAKHLKEKQAAPPEKDEAHQQDEPHTSKQQNEPPEEAGQQAAIAAENQERHVEQAIKAATRAKVRTASQTIIELENTDKIVLNQGTVTATPTEPDDAGNPAKKHQSTPEQGQTTAKDTNKIRHSDDIPLDPRSQIAPSIVFIRTTNDHPQAAGFILDNKGHILTSWQTINGTRDVDVDFMATPDTPPRTYKAKVIKYDKYHNLALLKFLHPPANIRPVSVSVGKRPDIGTMVRVFGQKDRQIWSADDAIIARVMPHFTWFSKNDTVHNGEILQVDLSLEAKNTASLVTTMDYQVLGIKSFSSQKSGKIYAISVHTILDFVLSRGIAATSSETDLQN